MYLAAERSSARSTLFPANTRGTLPASRQTSGIQYSSRDFHVSSRVTSHTRSTDCAPFAALSWTPAYPFCPRMSQTVMTSNTPRPAFGTTMSFFVTFVPIVARYSSPNWSSTKRRIREVLPTEPSPRSTTFAFMPPMASHEPLRRAISRLAGGYRRSAETRECSPSSKNSTWIVAVHERNARGGGFEPPGAFAHRVSNPAPYQARRSPLGRERRDALA